MFEFYMIFGRKIIKIPNFLWYLPEKIKKIPELYMIFARNMPKFYMILASKIFFPNFGGGAHMPPPVLFCSRLLRL